MKSPNAALVAVTAGLAFNAMPSAAVAQPEHVPTPEAAAANTQANHLMTELGGKLLALKKAAPHNHHVDTATLRSEAPNFWAVEIDYNGKRPSRHAPIGTYVVTGGFKSKSKHVNIKNMTDIQVSENAGPSGPLVGLELHKDEGGGYSFKGTYSYKKRHYEVDLEASTQPEEGQQTLTSKNIASVALQFRHLMKVAPTGAVIKKLLPPAFVKTPPTQPVIEQPAPPPVGTQPVLAETAPVTPVPPAIVPPVLTGPSPTPTPFYPETPGVKPWKKGEKGYDVGAPNTPPYPTDADFVYIGVNDGKGFTTNPRLVEQLKAFAYTRENLYANTGLYLESANIDRTKCAADDDMCLATQWGTNQADYTWNAAKNAGLTEDQLKVTWILDNEPGDINTWSDDIMLNRASYQAERDEFLRLGAANVVEYGTTDGHHEHFGDWNTGDPNIGATTWDTAEEASQYCTGHEYNGGPTWADQYDPHGIDKDVAC